MKKHLFISLLVATACSATLQAQIHPLPWEVSQSLSDHYRKRYLQFEQEPAIQSGDLVMLGNSLTEGGDWSRLLGIQAVVNRGIIGDDVPGMELRLHQVLKGNPSRICLLTGINDVSHDLPADTIAASICRLAERILRESPSTHLYLQSLLPINESFGRYRRLTGKSPLIPIINGQLREWAKSHPRRVTFINLYPLFSTSKEPNLLRADLTADGLHLNEQGYLIWSKALKKVLKKKIRKEQKGGK